MAAQRRRGVAGAVVAALVAVASGVLAAPASAAAVLGRTETSLQPESAGAGRAIAFLADGRYVVGGNTGADFGLSRTSNGMGDQSFGADSLVTTDFAGRVDVIRALARGQGYAVVAAGSSAGDAAVARYDLFGDLDHAFGTEGRVVTDLGGPDDAAYGVVVQPTGKVVVAGGNSGSTVIWRYNADGTPDGSFGSGGRVALPWARPARAIVAQADGALVVAGSGGASVDVARMTPDGALDSGFGSGGTVRVPTGAGTSANAMLVLGDGRMLVAGGRNGNVLLARLLPAGELDPSLGTGGIAEVDLGRQEVVNGVAMSPDGRIHVVGEASDGSGFASVHLPSGARDSGFGNTQTAAPLRAVGFDSDLRVVTGDGMLNAGAVQTARAAVRQPDGRIVVLAESSGVTGLVRYTTDGVLDPSFGVGGKILSDRAWNPVALVVQAGGRIVVAGTHHDSVALVGFRPDGSLDPTFGTAGRVLTDAGDEAVSDLSILPDGKLLASGAEVTGAFLARYSASGVPDATFGDGGLLRGGFAGQRGWGATLMQPDGKTLVARTDSINRFNPDGTPDTTFGNGGTRRPAANEFGAAVFALQPDGRILVGGSTHRNNHLTFAVMRLYPDGTRDTTWSTTYYEFHPGELSYRADELRLLFVQPDGRVLAVGDKVAARYRSDGTLDETFGNRGGMYFDHTAAGVVAAFFDPGGLLWSVGSDDTQWSHSIVLTLNRIPEVAAFHALAPARILDTRTGNGAPVARVGPQSSMRLQVTGRGGVPAVGVSAVVMNLTVTEPSEATFVTAWPAGTPRPLTSNINVSAGQTLPNLVTVATGSGGAVDLYNFLGSAHLIADVAGWFGPGAEPGGARYHPVSPSRLLDTRDGNGAPGAAPVGPGATLDLQVTGRGGVPAAGVSAVVMNVTAVSPTSGTFITASPAGQARPLASNLNLVANQTAPNLVVVAVGAGGRVSLYNLAGSVHLVADVAGWYGDGTEAGGARFHAFTPARILDTRYGNGAPAAPVRSSAPLALQVTGRGGVPAVDVSAVVLSIAVTEPTTGTHLTVWPYGDTMPLASNLNFGPGQTVANLVMVGVGLGGRVNIAIGGGATHVVVDVAGWYRG
jgi:uncharacterized delta-60 repeat protein